MIAARAHPSRNCRTRGKKVRDFRQVRAFPPRRTVAREHEAARGIINCPDLSPGSRCHGAVQERPRRPVPAMVGSKMNFVQKLSPARSPRGNAAPRHSAPSVSNQSLGII